MKKYAGLQAAPDVTDSQCCTRAGTAGHAPAGMLQGRERGHAGLRIALCACCPCVFQKPASLSKCLPLRPTLQVSFQGNGLLRNLQTIADSTGMVKGKVGNPRADPPLRPDGKLDVGAAVGRGMRPSAPRPV